MKSFRPFFYFMMFASVSFFSGCEKTPEDFANIAKTHSDAQMRENAVRELVKEDQREKNQGWLADIVINADDESVRMLAAEYLDEEPTIAHIVRSAPAQNSAVAMALLEKIEDEKILNELAFKAAQIDVRVAAVGKINNQEILANIARNTDFAAVSLSALNKIESQQAIADVAVSTKIPVITKMALDKINDKNLLVKIVENGAGTGAIRAVAMTLIKDDAIYTAMARNSKNDIALRKEAIGEIKDEKILVEFVLETKGKDYEDIEIDLAREAIENINDQALLEKWWSDRDFVYFQDEILPRLTNQTLLEEIALSDGNGYYREIATEKLTNEKVLIKLAGSNSVRVHEAALRAIEKNPAALAEVAKTAETRIARETAMEKITDQKILATFFSNDTDAELRLLALWQLKDNELIANIAKNDTDELVKKAAAAKLLPPPGSPLKGNVLTLLDEGKIILKIRGQNITSLTVEVLRMTPFPLEVEFSAGSYFVCDNYDVQNMVSTRNDMLKVVAESGTLSLAVACANLGAAIPDSDDSFVIGTDEKAKELSKLLQSMDKKNFDTEITQAAVWIISDDADYYDLGKLIIVRNFALHGDRAIDEDETAAAMRIVMNAGIDIKEKSIWADCQRILSGMTPGELKTWLKEYSGVTIPAHREDISAMAISDDGKLLATGDDSGAIKIWDLTEGKLKMIPSEKGNGICCLAFSPDGLWLIGAREYDRDADFYLWKIGDGSSLKKIKKEGEEADAPSMESAIFSAQGNVFWTGDSHGNIKRWSLPECELLNSWKISEEAGHFSSADSMVLADDEKTLVVTTGTRAVHFFDAEDGTLKKTEEKMAPMPAIPAAIPINGKKAFSPDKKILVTGDAKGDVKIWKLPEGELVKTLEGE